MRLGFDADAITERGTSTALFDYAAGAQSILGHEVVVFFNPQTSLPNAVERFQQQFRMVPFDNSDELRRATANAKLDFYYRLTGGKRREIFGEADRRGVHAVFRHCEPHGDVYAYVSEWLADWMSGGTAPFVPHIVDLPKPVTNWRDKLGIPDKAFVVGRYGGFDQFNLPFAKRAVIQALERRKDIFFLFVNTDRFCEHERVIHLPAVYSNEDKSAFIATCDVGLNAKKIGESFGLANAEFMALGKPVFSWAGGKDQNHVVMTPKSEWLYHGRLDLLALFTDYCTNASDQQLSRRSVAQFLPEAVMRQFEEVFLSGRFDSSQVRAGQLLKTRRYMQGHGLRARYKIKAALNR
ncbi:hypothetical protein [Roseibium sp.]|uniref:hypothetical protein n=1 Tax=Roseibium sp. TaxID=1936156 RepID=UPI003A98735A